ncbi:hypothetical protein SASPL_110609 [Salvia splendens]|uniref:phospholipid:diacylglycerol acyltransferase n=1 Tax=Salvia splendens TaxID=180675 RepID=A0A8X9A3H8_SALSN|nr:hypothetical protein SASPL_110609 [Salvia splendens]
MPSLRRRRAAAEEKRPELRKPKKQRKWSCLDNCCWFIGRVCVVWWALLFSYNMMPSSFLQYVTEAITGPMPDPPGVKLKKEGLRAKHPVVFVPGIVTGGLELWEGHSCAEGLFRKRLWGGTFGEVYKSFFPVMLWYHSPLSGGSVDACWLVCVRVSETLEFAVRCFHATETHDLRPLCWVEHMSLDNETGLDPPGVRVRPVTGLVAADYFAPGYFVWAVLIANLARIGYEEKAMYMAAYDWRLSFQNTEVRDGALSRIKSNIELMVATSGHRAVIIPHSMGVLYFLHFMKWVEAPAPMGGGGGPYWCAKHIKAVMNIGGPFLGVPKAVSGLFSAEGRDIAVARAVAPGVLDKDLFRIQTLQHIMKMTRTWDSTMSMIPKGGDTIWGGLDWSPEQGYAASKRKHNTSQPEDLTCTEDGNVKQKVKFAHYGRIISFGKDVAEAHSSEIQRIDFRDAVKGNNFANDTCEDVWTEYHDMGISGITAVAEYKAYFTRSAKLYCPKNDGAWKCSFFLWLPNAPDMEIFSMYGIGIPTERAYVYKQVPAADCYIPFQIDTSVVEEDIDRCVKDGVFTVDGDETVPVLSAGYMSAKAWRGKTRFNPSGMKTYDIMRVAAGATGEELGGDRVYSDIFKWCTMAEVKYEERRQLQRDRAFEAAYWANSG